MIDFNQPLRTAGSRLPVRVLDRDFRSRGFGTCTLCAIRENTCDLLILVSEDGLVHGHAAYGRVENVPSFTYVDMYEDGLLSAPRETRARGAASSFRKARPVAYTLEINNQTGDVRRV